MYCFCPPSLSLQCELGFKTELEVLGQNDLGIYDTLANLDKSVPRSYLGISSLFKTRRNYTQCGNLQSSPISLTFCMRYLFHFNAGLTEEDCTKYIKTQLQLSSPADASNKETPLNVKNNWMHKGKATRTKIRSKISY